MIQRRRVDESIMIQHRRVDESSLIVFVQYALPRLGWPAAVSLRRVAQAAWLGEGAASVTLRLVDREEGRALNAQFRGRDYATNVLSFPAPEEAWQRITPPCLGDILLCAPVLAEEAAEQQKSRMAHFAHMVVHGMLHLQGWDHADTKEAKAMEQKERELLAVLGWPDPYERNDVMT
jgi:probable rRNA maturation factor